jgi:acyl-coenzyme A thioesterase PaaI-like protein
MSLEAIQDLYPDEYSHCYGCGRLNELGMRIRSGWDGRESVAVFHPEPHHIGIPGFVYGGLIASLIDCHGVATAYAAARGQSSPGPDSPPRFVTAALHVDFLRPTPIGEPLTLRGLVAESRGRKVVVRISLLARGQECARGEVTAVRVPESMKGGATTCDHPVPR